MLKQKPSAKIKRRYLLVSGGRDLIEKAILDYVGLLGWAKAAPIFIKRYNKGWVVAIDRKEMDSVRGAFAVCSDKISVLKVSGTLSGLGIKNEKK